jgi:hypothetical protein
MQLFTSNGLSIPSQPARSGYNQPSSRVRYGGRGNRRNENGLLAIVERHRDAIHRGATLPQPADPAR